MKETPSKTGYEFIDHTADEGLKAYGKDLDELFENAASGMFRLISDETNVECIKIKKVTVKASHYEELLKNWLSELLYIHSSKHYLFKKFKVNISEIENGNKLLKGSAEGELFDPDKHSILTEIKTVTYHQLYVKNRDDYWEAQVIFDT